VRSVRWRCRGRIPRATPRPPRSVSVYVEGYVTGTLPSAIIDLTTPSQPRLLREGAVSAHAISEVIGREISPVP
jgi:tRNA A37 threonylcarbamoyladenosine synthetase subunit TsaC/SUA5/YrdC